MLDTARCALYSHKVRRILKRKHGIWLNGASDEMKAFFDLCLLYFAMREKPEAAAKCYVETCHDIDGRPDDVSLCQRFMSADCVRKLSGAVISEADETARRLRKLGGSLDR